MPLSDHDHRDSDCQWHWHLGPSRRRRASDHPSPCLCRPGAESAQHAAFNLTWTRNLGSVEVLQRPRLILKLSKFKFKFSALAVPLP